MLLLQNSCSMNGGGRSSGSVRERSPSLSCFLCRLELEPRRGLQSQSRDSHGVEGVCAHRCIWNTWTRTHAASRGLEPFLLFPSLHPKVPISLGCCRPVMGALLLDIGIVFPRVYQRADPIFPGALEALLQFKAKKWSLMQGAMQR